MDIYKDHGSWKYGPQVKAYKAMNHIHTGVKTAAGTIVTAWRRKL